MKRCYLKIIFFFLAINVNSQVKSGIEFSTDSFDDAVKTAIAENKPIFIDFTVDWCGPCRKMDHLVFTDSIVADFYNKNFICLKIDAERGEGIALKEKFNIKVYPTLLFLSPQLEIKEKSSGYKRPKEFIELGYSVVNKELSDSPVLNSVSNYESNLEQIEDISSFVVFLNPSEKDEILFEYFQDIPQNKWYLTQYFHLIDMHSYSIFSPLSQFVIANRERYSELFGKDRIDKFLSILFSNAYRTPKELYGKSFNNLSDDEIYQSLFQELVKIDSFLANKYSLDFEINALSKDVGENYNNTEFWDSLFAKIEYYNKHYAHIDQDWFNFKNKWYHRAVTILSKNSKIYNYKEIILKMARSRLAESDYGEFKKGLMHLNN